MTEPEVRVADDEDSREDAFTVRQTVFVEEQGVDEDLEYDEHDEPGADAVHFVASIDNEAVGAARLREYEPEDAVGKVERVAVLESRREEGVGRELMRAAEAQARELGLDAITLHSQTRAAEFYRRLGYEQRGEEFDEAGIPHVEMSKTLE